MLQATLHGDTDTMEEILECVHDTEVPIYSYNSEVELSAIVNLVYLSARDEYRVEREDKAGKGFVDFIFYPKKKDMPGIILELKIDHTPEEALEQIKQKNYKLRFQGKIAEETGVSKEILGVGISYDTRLPVKSQLSISDNSPSKETNNSPSIPQNIQLLPTKVSQIK